MLKEMIFVTTNKSLVGLSNGNGFITLTNCNDSNSYEGIDLLRKEYHIYVNTMYHEFFNTYIEII